MKSSILTTILFIFGNMIYGQTIFPEIMSCFGGYSQNEYVKLTWTAGEPFYETISNNQSILTQGFNQTVYITTQTGIKEVPEYSINVYPNPATNIINIYLQTQLSEKIFLQVFDLQGRMIINKETVDIYESLDISNLQAGTYLLNFTSNNLIIKAFKIQKIQ